MDDQFPNSFLFHACTISVNPDPSDMNSESSEQSHNVYCTMPEVYARFIESKKICHPNLASYVSFEQLSTSRAIILSESHSFNLAKLLINHVTQKKIFLEEEVIEIIREILRGLNKLARLGLPYLALTPENVLVTSSGSIKLAHPFDYFIIGPENLSNDYQAPELREHRSQGILFKLDTWSLGVLALELISLTKCPAFASENYYNFLNFEYAQTAVSPKFREILDLLLKVDENERIDLSDIYQHPFFSLRPLASPVLLEVTCIYYLWSRYKNIDSLKKLEQYLIANDLLPYNPAVLQVPSVLKASIDEEYGISILSRVSISLDGLLHEIKKDRDSESATVESKLLSDGASAKNESFIGRLGTLFRSKSAKSSHSSSSITSKQTDSFALLYKKFKVMYRALSSPLSEPIQVPLEGFPSCLRPHLWKKILGIDPGYSYLYEFLYDTRKFEINKQISLDVPRCHKNNIFLTSNLGRKRLETILKLWISQHKGVKYSQGLDSIAAVCICLFEEDEAAAYFAFDKILSKYLLNVIKNDQLIGNFLLVLRNLVSFVDPVLAQHLNANSINPEMYATSWLLTLCSHIFSLSSVYILWDLLLQEPPEFIFIIALSILKQFRKELLENSQNDIISFFSGINGKIDLERCMREALECAEKVPLGICKLVFEADKDRSWLTELPLEIAQISRSPLISLEDCMEILKDLIFVDTRSSEEYNKSRVKGSVNIPLKTGNDKGILPTIKLTQAQLQGLTDYANGKIILLIGDESLKSHSFGNILVKLGVPKVCILRGGIKAIKADKAEMLVSN